MQRRTTLWTAAAIGLASLTAPVTAHAEETEIAESFAGRRTVSDHWVGSGAACLTARRFWEGAIAGCNEDEVGNGVLRLTDDSMGQVGSVVYDSAVVASAGLDVIFNAAQWGGDGADGITFFLVEGGAEVGLIGAPGSGLGYAPDMSSGTEGVPHALLGVGLDVYGGFSTSTVDGRGCLAAPGFQENAVVIRGAGNGDEGYCHLASTHFEGVLLGDDREGATRQVRIRIDSADASPRLVTVFVDGEKVLQTDVPAEFADADTVKFGFAASTGSLTDYHEIWGLSVFATPLADEYVYEAPTVEDDASAISLPATGQGTGSIAPLAGGLIVLGAALAVLIRRRRPPRTR